MSKYFINANGDYFETNVVPTDAQIATHIQNGAKQVTKRPSHLYTYSNGSWVAPSTEVLNESLASEIRSQRDFLLSSEVDKTVSNPLRWADMSEETQAEWVAYRRALLDITDQGTFPASVTWPTKPSE
jgi:hypothetical protein